MSIHSVNCFQVPNAVVDKLMNEMSGNALKCLMFIIRQTRGWHKTQDSIAASKFVEKCGIARNTAKTAIDELVSLGLIRKVASEKATGLNSYSLTDLFDAGEVATTGSNSDLGQKLTESKIDLTGSNSDLVAGSNSDPTKDILFKDTIQKTESAVSENDTTPTEKKPKSEKWKLNPSHRPDFIELAVWDQYVKIRNASNNKLNTENKYNDLIRSLIRLKDKGQDPNLCLDQSHQKSWIGVFELKSEYEPSPFVSKTLKHAQTVIPPPPSQPVGPSDFALQLRAKQQGSAA